MSAVAPVSESVSNAQVEFLSKDDGLSVTIDTKRLHMRSVQETDSDNYALLFGDKTVMEKYATGVTKTQKEVDDRIASWVKRWREKDPCSGFAVFAGNEFVDHVVLGHGDSPGESELAFLFHQKYWKQGYGTEAMTALVREYAPAMVANGYLLEGKPLGRIVATSREDNKASCRILETVGMHKVGEEVKYGALRHLYAIELSEIQKGTADKAAAAFEESHAA